MQRSNDKRQIKLKWFSSPTQRANGVRAVKESCAKRHSTPFRVAFKCHSKGENTRKHERLITPLARAGTTIVAGGRDDHTLFV